MDFWTPPRLLRVSMEWKLLLWRPQKRRALNPTCGQERSLHSPRLPGKQKDELERLIGRLGGRRFKSTFQPKSQKSTVLVAICESRFTMHSKFTIAQLFLVRRGPLGPGNCPTTRVLLDPETKGLPRVFCTSQFFAPMQPHFAPMRETFCSLGPKHLLYVVPSSKRVSLREN